MFIAFPFLCGNYGLCREYLHQYLPQAISACRDHSERGRPRSDQTQKEVRCDKPVLDGIPSYTYPVGT